MVPRVLAVAGGAALLVSLWLSWYDLDIATGWTYYGAGADADAWESLVALDVALATLALATPVIAFRRPSVAPALGAVAVALVTFLLIRPPGSTDQFTLAPGAALALAGAVALCVPWLRYVAPLVLLASLWMPWYGVDLEPEGIHVLVGGEPGAPWVSSPWHVFAIADIALLVLALVSVWWRWAAVPAALLVLARIAVPPDGLEPRTGAFIALGAAVLTCVRLPERDEAR